MYLAVLFREPNYSVDVCVRTSVRKMTDMLLFVCSVMKEFPDGKTLTEEPSALSTEDKAFLEGAPNYDDLRRLVKTTYEKVDMFVSCFKCTTSAKETISFFMACVLHDILVLVWYCEPMLPW